MIIIGDLITIGTDAAVFAINNYLLWGPANSKKLLVRASNNDKLIWK
jgi:hypothetical protein